MFVSKRDTFSKVDTHILSFLLYSLRYQLIFHGSPWITCSASDPTLIFGFLPKHSDNCSFLPKHFSQSFYLILKI